jgi:hypothetical protein
MKYTILFFIILFLSSCATQPLKDYANTWLGANLKEYRKAEKNKSLDLYVQWWRDNKINKDYYLPNGNLVHVAPEREDCLVHWEVDKNTNKIIGYKFKGDKCY